MRAERKTVLVALAANASIAVAKGVAGALTGSAACERPVPDVSQVLLDPTPRQSR